MKTTNNIVIGVKNMVCARCIRVVKEELDKMSISYLRVGLGNIYLSNELTERKYSELSKMLVNNGFELLADREKLTISKIKTYILGFVNNQIKDKEGVKLSDLLAKEIGVSYSKLSTLFSEIEGKTIERYLIDVKIEKVKELIKYDELSVSQISYELNYSSPQHLSKQFKQITGITPSQFKINGERQKLDTI